MDPRLLALFTTYGVFLRREAIELGYRDDKIKALTEQGIWHRVRRGAYVPGDVWRAADARERYRLFCLAALRQSKTAVVASHASAVPFHQGPTWGLDLRVAHLTRVDGKTGRKEAGVQQHRGTIVDGDVVTIGSHQVMSPTRTALEVTTVAPVEASLCVMDDFLHRELTSKEALAARYDSMHHWPETLPTDLVLRLADGRCESVGETRARYLFWREGLPTAVPQYEVFDEQGTLVGRVDFAWPEQGVFLEFDGREKYLRFRRKGESVQDAVLREKRREELICAITGWRCIRITWADLQEPAVVAMRIRNLLFPGASAA